MVKILYFGRLSDRVGIQHETFELPVEIKTLHVLKVWLDDRHDLDGALDDKSIKTMIDQSLVHGDTPLDDCKEIGFLPPVGGG